MSETPQSEREAGAYLRLPLPVVAIGLFVVLAVLLALGLYANANLRSPGVILPTPAAAATPPPPTQALAAAAATQAPTSTPVSPTPRPTEAPTRAPIASATATIVATVGTSTPAGSADNATTPTPLPSVEPTLAAEVGQAYENFWRVRSQALLDLDPTHLPEVMNGAYLDNTESRIDELHNEGQAIKTQVSLSYSVLQASETSASVVDDIVDNSVYVTIGTEDAISEPTGDKLRVLYTLNNIGGMWKVVDSVRSE